MHNRKIQMAIYQPITEYACRQKGARISYIMLIISSLATTLLHAELVDAAVGVSLAWTEE